MARHDITVDVQIITEHGITWEQIERKFGPDIEQQGTRWITYSRRVADMLQQNAMDWIERDERSQSARQASMASERQVDYVVSLLARRTTEGGFAGEGGYYRADGSVDSDRVRSLTRAGASELITSLTESY